MPPPPRAILALLVAAGLSAAAPARAQPAPSPQAEALFSEGRDALQKGDYATACLEFTESFARSGSVGPLLNLAECEERRGRLATALARWKQGVTRLEDVPDDSRLVLARDRVEALEKRSPRLTVKLEAGAAAGVTALLDDQPIKSLPAEALPVDPGEHRISVAAPGHPERRLTVTLAEGEKKEIAIGAFAKAAEILPPPDGGDTRRTVGLIVGGLGVAGLAAFGITGALMLHDSAIVHDHCVEATRVCNDAAGLDAAAAGRALGPVNAIALGVGIAGVGVGVTLLVTSRGKAGARSALGAGVSPGSAGLSWRTTF